MATLWGFWEGYKFCSQKIKSGAFEFVDFKYLCQLLHVGGFNVNLMSEWTLGKFQMPGKFSRTTMLKQ